MKRSVSISVVLAGLAVTGAGGREMASGGGASGRAGRSDANVALLAGGPPGPAATMFSPGHVSSIPSDRGLTINPDGAEAFYTVSVERRRTIVAVRLAGGRWTAREVVPFSGVDRDSSPSLSRDGRRMVFASDRPTETGSARKDTNLWMVERRNGAWGEPVLLSAQDPYAGLDEARAVAVLRKGDWDEGILPAEGRVLHDLLLQKGCRRVVDVGTGEGHSALWFALAMKRTGGKVVTLELDPNTAARARRAFEAAGLLPWIELRVGDALKEIPKLEGGFDFVFLDSGVPGLNKKVLDLVGSRIPPGGMLACHSEAQMLRFHPDYVKALKDDPAWELTVLARGVKDGIGLATRRR